MIITTIITIITIITIMIITTIITIMIIMIIITIIITITIICIKKKVYFSISPAKTPSVGPLAAHKINNPFTTGRGAWRIINM